MPIISPPLTEVARSAHYSNYRVGVNKNQSLNYFEYECLFSVPSNEDASVYMFTDAFVSYRRKGAILPLPDGERTAPEDCLFIEPVFESELRKFKYLPRSSAIPYCIYQNLDGIDTLYLNLDGTETPEFKKTLLAIEALNQTGSETDVGKLSVQESVYRFCDGNEAIFIRGGTKIGKAKPLTSANPYQAKLTILFPRTLDENAVIGFFDCSQRNRVPEFQGVKFFRPYVGHPLISAVRGVPAGTERVNLYQIQNLTSASDDKYDRQELNGELVTMDFDTYPPTLSLQQALSPYQKTHLPTELAYLVSDQGFGKQSFKIFNPDARQLSVIDATPGNAFNPTGLQIRPNTTTSQPEIEVTLESSANTADSRVQVKDVATNATLFEIIVRVLPFKAVPVRFHTTANSLNGVTLHQAIYQTATHLSDVVKAANVLLGKQANIFVYPKFIAGQPQYETSVVDGWDMGLHVPLFTKIDPRLVQYQYPDFGRDFWTDQLSAIGDRVDASCEFNAFYIWSIRMWPIIVLDFWYLIDNKLTTWPEEQKSQLKSSILAMEMRRHYHPTDTKWEVFTSTLDKQLLKDFVDDPTLTPIIDKLAFYFFTLANIPQAGMYLGGIAPAGYWALPGRSSMSVGDARLIIVKEQVKYSAPSIPLINEEGVILAHEFCHAVAHNLDPSEQVHFSHLDVGVNSVEGNLMFKFGGWQLLTLQKDLLHNGLPNY